jgi:hypothetical protein
MNRLVPRGRRWGAGACGAGGGVTGVAPLTVSRDRCSNILISVNPDPALFFAFDSTGAEVGAASQTLELDSVVTNPGTAYSSTAGHVKVPSAGYYELSYRCQFQSQSEQNSHRASIRSFLEVDAADGAGFQLGPGSASSCAIVGDAGPLCCPGSSKSVILNMGEGSVLRLRFLRFVGTTSARTRPGESSLAARKL